MVVVLLRRLGFGAFVLFALIGFGFCGVFIAMQGGLLNVRGTIAERNQFFGSVPKVEGAATIKGNVPKTRSTASCVDEGPDGSVIATCAWNQNPEWTVVREGLTKDAEVIDKVSEETGVDSRMIAASVVPEQLRFFTSERENYKKFFEPMKILGSMSQFSLGVAGIKQQTANQIERNLVDTNAPLYPGKDYSNLITYAPGTDHDSELYKRLTDSKHHYYSYLYTALYIKEINAQWQKQGYDLTARPDVVTTLFNIGFEASKPKDNPQIGGTPITLGSTTYSFGQLGTLFYLSDELIAPFPRA
jgi:hypothetical protein